jgi:predicted membrane-bound mannosyltransferase
MRMCAAPLQANIMSGMLHRTIPFLLLLALAAALRLPWLGNRPMHADEAILADKFGTLLETGSWRYDPGDYHGPALAYATLIPARLAGARNYQALTEPLLRIVPALCGLALVLFPMLVSGALGWRRAWIACTLTALSPAMVYYSRYYIPEMLLVTLTAAAIATAWFYACRPGLPAALLFGALLGLMFAAKETAAVAAGAMLVAAAIALRPWKADWRLLAAAGAVALATIAMVLGPREAAASFAAYLHRGFAGGRHVHPWYYYFATLAPADGIVLALGAVGIGFAFTRGEGRFARFLAVYTAALAAAYSLAPYKTPWCALGFLHGLILLGAIGLDRLADLTPKPARAPAAVLAAFCAGYLGYMAYRTSYTHAADPRNSYAYAHTTTDVFAVRDRLSAYRGTPIQIFTTANIWPLPWYLRSFPHVEWWRGVREDATAAPVILAAPEMEPALIHWLYESPPPGERHLYTTLFDREIELRPGLELRGYVRQDLALP